MYNFNPAHTLRRVNIIPSLKTTHCIDGLVYRTPFSRLHSICTQSSGVTNKKIVLTCDIHPNLAHKLLYSILHPSLIGSRLCEEQFHLIGQIILIVKGSQNTNPAISFDFCGCTQEHTLFLVLCNIARNLERVCCLECCLHGFLLDLVKYGNRH